MKQKAKEILKLANRNMHCSISTYGERINDAKKLYMELEKDFAELSKEERKEFRNLKDKCHDSITSMVHAYYEW